jgi:hypothetical protein
MLKCVFFAHKRKKPHWALVASFCLMTGGALASAADQLLNDGCALSAVLGVESSGGRTDVVNPRSTAMGRQQITLNTMVAIGAANCTTGRPGACPVREDAFGVSGVANRDQYATVNREFFQGLQVNSWQDVLTGPDALAAQQRMERAYFSSNVAAAERAGLMRYAGNSNNALGIPMNNGAMLQCLQAGVGNCRSMMENGTAMSGSASEIRHSIDRAGRTYSPTGDCPASNLDDGVRDPNRAVESNVTDALYCNPEVLRLIQEQGGQEVDRRVSLAADSRTGYTLIGGDGVMDAAFDGGSSASSDATRLLRRTSIGSDTGSFRGLSCLRDLLNSGGSIMFSPPNLLGLLQALENAACAQLRQLVSNATRPLNQSLYRNASLDGFFPGSGLGSMGLGGIGGMGGVRVGAGPGYSGFNVGSTNGILGEGSSNFRVSPDGSTSHNQYGPRGRSSIGRSLFEF